MRAAHADEAITAADQALAIAEPRSMIQVIVEAFNSKGGAMDLVGRWRESTLLLEGAVSYRDDDRLSPELRLRSMNNLASVLSSDNPIRASEILAEAIELARRWGVRSNLYFLINHYTNVNAYLGRHWDENQEMLRQALEEATDDADRSTLVSALLVYDAIRGENIEAGIKTWKRLAAGREQVNVEASQSWLRGWAAYVRDDRQAAWNAFRRDNELEPAEGGAVIELLHAAVISGDPANMREAASKGEQFPGSGRLSLAFRTWARSVSAALERRTHDAVAGFVEADQGFADIGIEWLQAEMAIDAVLLLPNEPHVQPLAERSRQILERLRATVHLAQLETALSAAGEVTREREVPAQKAAVAAERESH
jgi:tetratricopeptide (TPR) repeat protein